MLLKDHQVTWRLEGVKQSRILWIYDKQKCTIAWWFETKENYNEDNKQRKCAIVFRYFPKHAEISRASTTMTIKYVYGFSLCAHRLPSARESGKYTLLLV